jgi:hypothetical protein
MSVPLPVDQGAQDGPYITYEQQPLTDKNQAAFKQTGFV